MHSCFQTAALTRSDRRSLSPADWPVSWFASINEGGTWSLLMCSLLTTCKHVLIAVGPQQSTPLEYSLTSVVSLFCGRGFAKGSCRVVRLERNYHDYNVKKKKSEQTSVWTWSQTKVQHIQRLLNFSVTEKANIELDEPAGRSENRKISTLTTALPLLRKYYSLSLSER